MRRVHLNFFQLSRIRFISFLSFLKLKNKFFYIKFINKCLLGSSEIIFKNDKRVFLANQKRESKSRDSYISIIAWLYFFLKFVICSVELGVEAVFRIFSVWIFLHFLYIFYVISKIYIYFFV